MTDEKAHPTLVVRGLHLTDGNIGLVKDRGGAWSLPGGYIKTGESPRGALLRELGEETGCQGSIAIQSSRPWVLDGATGDTKPFTVLRLIYPVWIAPDALPFEERAIDDDDDVVAFRLWPMDALPPLCTRRGTTEDLERILGHVLPYSPLQRPSHGHQGA